MELQTINPTNLQSKDVNPVEYDITKELYDIIINDKEFAVKFWINLNIQYKNRKIILVIH